MEFTVREINWQDESAWDEHWRIANLVSREVAGQSAWQLTSEQAAERVRTTPNRSYCYLNATVDGLTVGAGRLRTVLDDEPAHSFLDISVLPEFRRVGIGAALAAGLLEAARSHGSRRIDAFVMAGAGTSTQLGPSQDAGLHLRGCHWRPPPRAVRRPASAATGHEHRCPARRSGAPGRAVDR